MDVMAFGGVSVALVLEAIMLLALLQFIYSLTNNLLLSPLARFPGPLLNRISPLPFDLASIRGDTHAVLTALHATYGPTVRIRPNELSTIDATAWKDVFGLRPRSAEFAKGQAPVRANGARGLADAARADHRRYRRLFGGALSPQGVRGRVAGLVGRHAALLADGLDRHAGGRRSVDVLRWLRWAAQDIVGDLAFGEPFGCVERAADHPWTQFLHRAMLPIVVLSVLQNWGVDGLAALLTPASVRKVVEENHQFVCDAVSRRLALGGSRGDLLDEVVEDGALGRDGGLRLDELHNICFDLVAAGSDTTAHVLTAAVFELVRHPAVLRDVNAEVRAAFASAGAIDADEAAALPIMNAVLQDALRLHHPAAQLASRVAPAGGVAAGVAVPAGTRITFTPAVAFQSAVHFARPMDFAPERWLKGAEGWRGEFERDNRDGVWQPFSAGPRNCIGLNLAWIEMRLILALLLWKFDLARPEGDASWEGWVQRTKAWLLMHPEPLFVDIKRRQDPA